MEIDYTKTIIGVVGTRCKAAIEHARNSGSMPWGAQFPDNIEWPTAIEIAHGPLTVSAVEPILSAYIREWKNGYDRNKRQ